MKPLKIVLLGILGAVLGVIVTVLGIIILFFADILDIRESNVLTVPLLVGSLGGFSLGCVVGLLFLRRKTSRPALSEEAIPDKDTWPPPPTQDK